MNNEIPLKFRSLAALLYAIGMIPVGSILILSFGNITVLLLLLLNLNKTPTITRYCLKSYDESTVYPSTVARYSMSSIWTYLGCSLCDYDTTTIDDAVAKSTIAIAVGFNNFATNSNLDIYP